MRLKQYSVICFFKNVQLFNIKVQCKLYIPFLFKRNTHTNTCRHTQTHTHTNTHKLIPRETFRQVDKNQQQTRKAFGIIRNSHLLTKNLSHESDQNELGFSFLLSLSQSLSVSLLPSFFPFFLPSFLLLFLNSKSVLLQSLPLALYLELYKLSPYICIIQRIYLKFGNRVKCCCKIVARGTLGTA